MVADSLSSQGVEQSAPFSHTEVFNKRLPYYLMIGMTYEQYWDGDPELVKFYREADDLRKKRQNEILWLQGMYIYEAIYDNVPLLRMGSKETKPIPYSNEPYPLTEEEIQAKKERQEKLRYEQMMQMMQAWKSNVNETFASRKENGCG